MTAPWQRLLCVLGLATALLSLALLPGSRERSPALVSPATTSGARLAAQGGKAVAAGVAGLVTGDGRALAGALVCLACTGCEAIGGPPSTCAYSDSSGHYALFDVAPGSYRVHASAAGFSPFTSGPEQVLWIHASRPLRRHDIALAAGGVALAGVVQDATGGPVARARVRAVRSLPPQFVLERECDDVQLIAYSRQELAAAESAAGEQSNEH